ncbi:cobalamin B12-binding domain-containing protein [Paractinoplanes atraurantiacus]|uniref:Methanogenic corrinoid protein MtbC1 n=1 Tax=Paractinoplanes atraurantiacus TaxID=1036182 RepID=A0A285KFK8_9ACTN|nr:cobalamin-dependent protein [Actinoplanes atraurantiacus]SNY71400.1 Methanogenic corrinoid protein MtbC1 [Actinoplanes atraurantiacus]
MTAATHPECPALLGHLLSADEQAALRLVRRLVETGSSPEDILLRLIAPVQADIGELWAANHLSVAGEHVASYINERAAAVACAGSDRPPWRPEKLVVVCADGEWHTLPSRLLAETLRLRGFAITFLGASVPPAHLTSYLQQEEPAAVLLSISLPVRLPSARRSVQAARLAGVPILCGGRGFGDSARWARRLGADAWAADAVEAAAVLEDWPPRHPARAGLDHLADDEYSRLVKETPALVASALAVLDQRFRPMSAYTTRQREATVEDLGHIAAFLAAAVYVDDDTLFTRFLQWLAPCWPPGTCPRQAPTWSWSTCRKR